MLRNVNVKTHQYQDELYWVQLAHSGEGIMVSGVYHLLTEIMHVTFINSKVQREVT